MPRNSKHRFYSQTKKVWKSPKEYLEKGVAAATIAGTIVLSTPVINADAATGILLQRLNSDNPLKAGFSKRNFQTPALVDIDADGDLDVFLGGFGPLGEITYYKNNGSVGNPDFTEQTDGDNPFNFSTTSGYSSYDFQDKSSIEFADIDGDNDLDAFIGKGDGEIEYFKNTGTASAPVFVRQTGTNNPFNGFDFGSDNYPSFADLDADGDLDVFIGNRCGNIHYLRNTGTVTTPVFAEIEMTSTSNPLHQVDVPGTAIPDFADIDDDGDLDAFIGNRLGEIEYFENTGSSSAPSFNEVTGSNNPANSIAVGRECAPDFADIDGDGDLDLIVGEYDVEINLFENTGTVSQPQFTEVTDSSFFKDGFDGGYDSKITFADIDGDGDMDAVVGSGYIPDYYGTVKYYENTGTPANPVFEKPEDTDNPFMRSCCSSYYPFIYGMKATPSFSDIDGDGDLDLMIGSAYYSHYSYVRFYENTGGSQAPVFERPDNADNPFMTPETGTDPDYNYTQFGENVSPVFADIDGDGDLDIFSGEGDDSLSFFTNTGTAGSPSTFDFTEATAADNPFRYMDTSGSYQLLDIGEGMAPVFEDVDGDGDLDAVIGMMDGTIKYYENTGTETEALFVERTGVNNRFSHIKVSSDAAPAFVDIDDDGDRDLFVGKGDGTFDYYESVTGGGSSSSCFIDTVDDAENKSVSLLSVWKDKIKNTFKKLF